MKKLIFGMAAFSMAAVSFMTTACDSLGDMDVTNPNQAELDANWLAKFGEIDSNQDWTLATSAPAKVSVYGIDALSDYQLQCTLRILLLQVKLCLWHQRL